MNELLMEDNRPTLRFLDDAGEGTAEEDKSSAAQADSDCIEILPASLAPRLTGDVNSRSAINGHAPHHNKIKEEEQQNMGPRSKVWLGTASMKGEDSSAAAMPGFRGDALSGQPATLMEQLSKGRKSNAGASQVEVQALLAMGFTEAQARKALQNCSHDVQRAANWLLAGT